VRSSSAPCELPIFARGRTGFGPVRSLSQHCSNTSNDRLGVAARLETEVPESYLCSERTQRPLQSGSDIIKWSSLVAPRMSSLPNSATKQRIDADGFAVLPGALRQSEMDTLRADIDKTPLHRTRAGARHMLGNTRVAALASDHRLLEIARQVLGAEARPFRATLFDKSPTSNWLVVWHQDTALPLRERHELPGWGPCR